MKNTKRSYEGLRPTRHESKYVDYDDAAGAWCVFGSESGFAYSSWASEEQAGADLTMRESFDKK